MSWKSLMLSLCALSSLNGAIERKIDEKNPIEVVFSRTSHNRISVEGETIEKIIGNSSFFSVTLDRTTGNAFITILQNIDETPQTLTVVTGSGNIQDIVISFREGLSEHLILKDAEEMEEILLSALPSHTLSIEFLNQILEGNIPLGYGQREVMEEEKIEVPKPLRAIPIKALDSPLETIVIYKICNKGRQPIVLTAEALKKNNHSWVFLNVHELKSSEQALCIISFQKR